MSIPSANALQGIAAPLAEAMGLTIWGIEVLGGNRPIFRIYVEAKNNPQAVTVEGELNSAEALNSANANGTNALKGADIDQCAELSRLLGLSLDVEDIMPEPYALEISSPGLERSFFNPEQLKNYLGQTVSLQLYSPEHGPEHEPESGPEGNPEDGPENKPQGSPENAPTGNWPGRKKFQGRLEQVVGNTISLLLNDNPVDDNMLLTTKWENIQRARLVHDFNANKGQKKGQSKARS